MFDKALGCVECHSMIADEVCNDNGGASRHTLEDYIVSDWGGRQNGRIYFRPSKAARNSYLLTVHQHAPPTLQRLINVCTCRFQMGSDIYRTLVEDINTIAVESFLL